MSVIEVNRESIYLNMNRYHDDSMTINSANQRCVDMRAISTPDSIFLHFIEYVYIKNMESLLIISVNRG